MPNKFTDNRKLGRIAYTLDQIKSKKMPTDWAVRLNSIR